MSLPYIDEVTSLTAQLKQLNSHMDWFRSLIDGGKLEGLVQVLQLFAGKGRAENPGRDEPLEKNP